MIFIDTNVVIDVLDKDVVRAQRAGRALNSVSAKSISTIVYAELAPGFEDRSSLDAILGELGIGVVSIPMSALFLAGQAYKAYRLRGGSRERMLADFLIGAQAIEASAPLLTRDPTRYRTSFPELMLIEP
jgi:predicted nucleic acid-binding protein